MLGVIMPRVSFLSVVMLSVSIPSVNMLGVIMPSVALLRVIMLTVIIKSVVMPGVIMLSVLALSESSSVKKEQIASSVLRV